MTSKLMNEESSVQEAYDDIPEEGSDVDSPKSKKLVPKSAAMSESERLKRLEKELNIRVGFGMPSKNSDDEQVSDPHNSSSKKKGKSTKKADNTSLKQTMLMFKQNNTLAGAKRGMQGYDNLDSD